VLATMASLPEEALETLLGFVRDGQRNRLHLHLSDLDRQLDNFCVRNHLAYAKRPALSGFVVVKADIHAWNILKFLCPLLFERFGAGC